MSGRRTQDYLISQSSFAIGCCQSREGVSCATIYVMAHDDNNPGRNLSSTRLLALRMVAIAIMVAVVLVILIAFSHERVCNQAMTSSGKIATICRHLESTDPPVIAGGLVVLACLGVFFSEISGFGFSLKREVVQTKREMAETREEVQDIRGAAQSAQSAAQMAQELSLRASPERSTTVDDVSALEAEIHTLVDEYNTTRRTMPSGAARTAKMTTIVSNMISLLNDVKPAPFDVAAYLNSENDGQRLAAYAYLYANPDPRFAPKIASALANDKPFGQYWGLKTLRRQVQTDPEALDFNTRRSLEELLGRLGPGTDRAYELRHLLQETAA